MSPPISAANTGSLLHRGGNERVCAAAGQGQCLANRKPCSCQDAVSTSNAGEMDGASTAVLVLGTEQILVRKKTPRNKNYSAVLEVFYQNRGIF